MKKKKLNNESELIQFTEIIERKIHIIRGQKVMLDVDLAEIYGVLAKRLNEQVKRNKKRFPEDFMFQLSLKEKNELVANCDHLKKLKFSYSLPYAFTEHGVAMLSSVLNSTKAIQMNIYIIRAFIKMREMLSIDKNLELKLLGFEIELSEQKGFLEEIFEILKTLIDEPIKPSGPVGFVALSK